jgi:ketosteroid isomerase-like protein
MRDDGSPGSADESTRSHPRSSEELAPMSQNKQTVERYMEAFARTDHAEVLACLTDDVEWVIPGAFHLHGKEQFDGEIENDAFEGSPAMAVTRLTEEHDVVIAEGRVRTVRKDGAVLHLAFCDVFEMRDAKIRRLTSYLMQEGQPGDAAAQLVDSQP